MKDPSKFAAAAPVAAPTTENKPKAAEPAPKAAAPESDDDDMGGLDIFG